MRLLRRHDQTTCHQRQDHLRTASQSNHWSPGDAWGTSGRRGLAARTGRWAWWGGEEGVGEGRRSPGGEWKCSCHGGRDACHQLWRVGGKAQAGSVWGTGSVHRGCQASPGGHGSDGRRGLRAPTRTRFNHALGLLYTIITFL